MNRALATSMAWRRLVAALVLLMAGAAAGRADGPRPTIIVFDSSGSMAAALPDGRTKLDAARAAVAEALASWPADGRLGLVAYGHRRKSDCSDIETVLPLGAPSPHAVERALAPLKARGKTPLSRALETAATLLPQGGAIVLVSDGIETCDADPCAVAAALQGASAPIAIQVVGFGLKRDEVDQLACIARRGGGAFFDAEDVAGLTDALQTVTSQAAEPAPPPPPDPAPTPEPAPAPEPPTIVRTQLTATAGALGPIVDAAVRWTVRAADGTIVYAGESRALALDLKPGEFDVTAATANATGERRITVSAGEEQAFDVAVQAGRLDLSLAPSPGAPPYSDADLEGLVWTLEPLDGQAAASAPPIARPSLLLAPGAYRVRAAAKGLTAEARVVVATGSAQAAGLDFRLGAIVLEAALDGAGEPLDEPGRLRWRVGQGDAAVSVEGQARPRLVLPEGDYPVVLAVSGFEVPGRAAVKAGAEAVIRIVVPGGTLSLSARLGPRSPPLDDWRDTFWTIAPIEALETASPIEAQEPTPTVPLPAGRWRVTLKSGAASAERDVAVAPGQSASLSLELSAGRVTMNAVPAGDMTPSNVVYAATALDAQGAPAAQAAFETGSSEGASTVLPAGRWRLTADDADGRHAETALDLAAGDERRVALEWK